MVATPILVLVLSGVLIGERITRNKAMGVASGAVGAIMLIVLGTAHNDGATMLGDLFILINACSYAVFLVMVKPLMSKYSAVTVMAWCFLVGSVIVVPFGLHEFSEVDWQGLTAPDAWSLAFVVVMVTFVAYLLNTWALRIVQPSVAGTFIYLQPLLALLASYFVVRGDLGLGVAAARGCVVHFYRCVVGGEEGEGTRRLTGIASLMTPAECSLRPL